MPIYEYRCEACGHELEVLQGISEAVLEDCPSCGKSALRKLVSAAAFRLKGTGWYETDFKNKDKKPKQPAGKAEGDGKVSEKESDKGSKASNDKNEVKTSSSESSAGTGTD
jgi:putative FmdB family regulatory protein